MGLEILKKRFEENIHRHTGMEWDAVETCLKESGDVVSSLEWMEETGGEPDVVVFADGKIAFCDCSAETPAGRRSICYDGAARVARKKNAPESSAQETALEHGVRLITEEEYRVLQTVGAFDQKTSSWIETPDAIRNLGGALFMEKRYGSVFLYHNGADSYYGVRGFRAVLPLNIL